MRDVRPSVGGDGRLQIGAPRKRNSVLRSDVFGAVRFMCEKEWRGMPRLKLSVEIGRICQSIDQTLSQSVSFYSEWSTCNFTTAGSTKVLTTEISPKQKSLFWNDAETTMWWCGAFQRQQPGKARLNIAASLKDGRYNRVLGNGTWEFCTSRSRSLTWATVNFAENFHNYVLTEWLNNSHRRACNDCNSTAAVSLGGLQHRVLRMSLFRTSRKSVTENGETLSS